MSLHDSFGSTGPIQGAPDLRLQRQRRGSMIRANRWNVRASDADAKIIKARAERVGVTVPRLMVSLAISSKVRSSVERKMTLMMLNRLGRQLAGVGNNLNQLAQHANSMSELPEAQRLDEALRSVEGLRFRIGSILDEVEKA